MDGVPAVNRWPKWVTRLLWALLIAGLIGLGASLRNILAMVSAGAGLLGDNAPETEAVAQVVQAVVIIVGLIYAHRQLNATRAISARSNTLQLIFEEHRDSTVAEHRSVFREVRDDDDDRVENYFDLKEYKAKIRSLWDVKRRGGELHVNTPQVSVDVDVEVHTLRESNAEEPNVTEPGDKIEKAWDKYWEKNHAKKWKERRKAVSAVLNRYEAFAIGVDSGAIDEEMYKRWWKTTLIDDWYTFRPLVLKLKERNPRAYIEFQALAERWQKEATKELQDSNRGKSTW